MIQNFVYPTKCLPQEPMFMLYCAEQIILDANCDTHMFFKH